MALELEGRLIHKLPVAKGTSQRGEWQRQDFVIETIESYPRKICLNVFGADKVQELTSYNEGDIIKASVNIESREYNGKWYTDIRAWQLRKAQEGAQQSAPVSAAPATPEAPVEGDAADDLPF